MPKGVLVDKETKEKVIALATGPRPMSVPALAERFGVSTKSIWRWLKEAKMSDTQEAPQNEEVKIDEQPREAPAEQPAETQPEEAPVEEEQEETEPEVPAVEEKQPKEGPEAPAEPAKDEEVEDDTIDEAEPCPNPSCGKPLPGTVCANCGYDKSKAVTGY